jgi:branched-chain amino acid transport system permease protein
MIIGFPTLRLRGDYLAIVTLGFGEILPGSSRTGTTSAASNLTNGTIGIKGHRPPGFPFADSARHVAAVQHAGFEPLVLPRSRRWSSSRVYVNVRAADSRLGRAWISVREDETAAAADWA